MKKSFFAGVGKIIILVVVGVFSQVVISETVYDQYENIIDISYDGNTILIDPSRDGISYDRNTMLVDPNKEGPRIIHIDTGQVETIEIPEAIHIVPYEISGDGSVVVGIYQTTDLALHGFRWTADKGAQDIGIIAFSPGDDDCYIGISQDGSVIIGAAYDENYNEYAFRWTEEGGMEKLGGLGGNWSAAYSVSADGSVIVGFSETADGKGHSFRWTADTGMQDLGIPGVESDAELVSGDGLVIVGEVRFGESDWKLYRLQYPGKIEYFDGLEAYDINDNGSIVIGLKDDGINSYLARWIFDENDIKTEILANYEVSLNLFPYEYFLSYSTKIDQLFDWGESNYSGLLPKHVASKIGYGYYYRFYPETNIYVGTKDNRLFVYNANGSDGVIDLGSLSEWFSKAGLQ